MTRWVRLEKTGLKSVAGARLKLAPVARVDRGEAVKTIAGKGGIVRRRPRIM